MHKWMLSLHSSPAAAASTHRLARCSYCVAALGWSATTPAICTTTKPYLLDKLRRMAHHVLIIWALAKALDQTDYCSTTDAVEGQLAGWCWKPLLTKDWQLQPCWLGNDTHTFTQTHTHTHPLKLLDAFPLSSLSPPPPPSYPVFHRCGYSCALSIFLSSFIPPPLRLWYPEQRGGFSFWLYQHRPRWIDGDAPAAAPPCRTHARCHSACLSLCLSLSPCCGHALSALILLLTAQPSLTPSYSLI